jgi:hypothetical protein
LVIKVPEEGEGIEIADFTHIPYPAAWDRDPEENEFADEVLHAANAWYRAAHLWVEQGFAPEDCEAEIVRSCAQVTRGQRNMWRQLEKEEAEYAALAADESLCEFPWGRLCPEHGNTLTETRRGVRCRRKGCERRWPGGHLRGHCDQPAVVVTNSTVKSSEEWRLCAGIGACPGRNGASDPAHGDESACRDRVAGKRLVISGSNTGGRVSDLRPCSRC